MFSDAGVWRSMCVIEALLIFIAFKYPFIIFASRPKPFCTLFGKPSSHSFWLMVAAGDLLISTNPAKAKNIISSFEKRRHAAQKTVSLRITTPPLYRHSNRAKAASVFREGQRIESARRRDRANAYVGGLRRTRLSYQDFAEAAEGNSQRCDSRSGASVSP